MSGEKHTVVRSTNSPSVSEAFGVSADHVIRQLSAILQSRKFRDAPMLQRYLRYLVEETLGGRGYRLEARTIANQVFKKGDDFRSSKDATVRVATNRLRNAVELYYLTEGLTDELLIEIEPGNYRLKFRYRAFEPDVDAGTKALDLAIQYQKELTASTHQHAFRSLRSALSADAENVELLSAYADICLDAHKYGFARECGDLFDEGWRSIELASSIDPDHPAVIFNLAMFELFAGNLDQVSVLGHRLMNKFGDDPEVSIMANWMLTLTMPLRAIADTVDLEPPVVSQLPGWMNHSAFLARYDGGDYESALAAAIAFGMPNFFWGPLERAAALAQLELTRAAEIEVQRLMHLNPAFASNARWYLGQYIPQEDALEHVFDGLAKAGLPRR